MRYSLFSLIGQALQGHRGWTPAWRDPAPKPSYDVIVIGGGGHGLATAYYLAKNHGIRDVALLEKSYVGSGNAGRNTIPGLFQLGLNASLNRVWRFGDTRRQIQLRLAANNALNHVTITNVGTVVNSATYGLPTAASQTRTATLTLRFNF